ncbi:enoyl-[acyl-carrier-protein] reductase, mitochondrial-like [Centruroides sculpturatus]|uniref:enoyl-[acyl-carrier-protein] reductase, mitochondrial-like n=1 Tax=Centruroides sculpturatus TaxID=218467 RepID=UPI000C6E6937|nr:enoyl-[acyl-carrier-protein] reductase, mitochondrial-like [Centruroides sculpturatus]
MVNVTFLEVTLRSLRWHSPLRFCRRMKSALVYREYGEPLKVVKKEEQSLKKLEGNEVLIKMLAAPINPADINMIQGTYALKPTFPAIGGNEGVGEVVEIGSNVKNLKVGSWIIPSLPGWGTWRTHGVCVETGCIEVDNKIPLIGAATMAVNPCTAYRMLKDFEDLKPGDWVIQNGGNSGVGQAVIQIAKQQGIHTINVVRQRPNFNEVKEYLTSLGADFVLNEEEIRSASMKDFFKSIPKPKLALNCVGGKSATDIMRHLADKGTIVTYGGMSKEPVTVPTSVLIFKDIKVVGYWMSRWTKENAESEERKAMYKYICDLLRDERLKAPNCKLVPYDNFADGIGAAMQPYVTHKQILIMDESTRK